MVEFHILKEIIKFFNKVININKTVIISNKL